MKLYLAGAYSAPQDFRDWIRETFPDVGFMCTYAEKKSVDIAMRDGFPFILDSGAFSVRGRGLEIDIDQYIEYVLDLQAREVDFVPTALDVIGDGEGSLRNWEYTLGKGVWMMPVFHVGESPHVLDAYIQGSDYVGLGGMAGGHVSYKLAEPLGNIVTAHPDTKFHVFGVNSFAVVRCQPYYSCDALTWRNGSRFGQLVLPESRWFVGRAVDRYSDSQQNELKTFFKGYGLNYPFPEDFDFKQLDKVNLRVLYQEIVANHNGDVGQATFEELDISGAFS